MYADTISDSMKEAIDETKRRRTIQEAYNEKNGITPKTIIKEIREVITNNKEEKDVNIEKMPKKEKSLLMQKIEEEMKDAASKLDFERATELRDILFELKSS